VRRVDWLEGSEGPEGSLLEHRHLVWQAFQESRTLDRVHILLETHQDWRWTGMPNLLDGVADLPLTPRMAFAASYLGPEAMGFQTFKALAGLEPQEAGRLLVTLWALGSLYLSEGSISAPWLEPESQAEPASPPEVAAEPLPPVPPTRDGAASGPLPAAPGRDRAPSPVPAPPPPALNEGGSRSPRFAEADMTTGQSPVITSAHAARPLLQDSQPMEIPLLPPAPPAPAAPPPPSPAALLTKAKRVLGQQRTGEAIRLLEQFVQMDPDSPAAYEPWMLLGRLRTANPAWTNRALEAYQVAARIRPKSGEPWMGMGEIYSRKGSRSNAQECYLKARALDPMAEIPQEVLAEDYLPKAPDQGLFSRMKQFLGLRS
jgi:hypothetical protein